MSEADKKFGPLKTVDQLDLQKFMGRWYVIANIPTYFEKGAVNAVETYTWNQAEERIDVEFVFLLDSVEGKQKTMTQKAFVHNSQTNAEWRIQLLWPFRFPYLVIDLAEDYSYTVIGVPDRKYVWIMARRPTLEADQYQKILAKLSSVGYDVSQVQLVPQIWR